MAMAVQVYISHTGRSLPYEEKDGRLELLRPWIERNAGIPTNRQILMSARGKNVKNLVNETEIFVYDKQFLSSDSTPPSFQRESLPALPNPPSAAIDESSLHSWQELFRSQRSWALEAVEAVRSGVETAEGYAYETEVVARSIGAALDNLRNHVTSLGQKFSKTEDWALDRLQEHQEVLRDWEASAKILSELPVREDVANVLRRPADARSSINTLSDLIDIESLRNIKSSLKSISQEFEDQLKVLQSSIKRVKADATNAEKDVVQPPEVDAAAFIDEAETLAKRISNDYEEILKLTDSPESLTTASKKAASHARDLQPTLQAIIEDLKQTLQVCQDSRNETGHKLYVTLQDISRIQSRLADLQGGISGLDLQDSDSLPVLSRVFQLPTVYGCTLIEAIRRSEWTHKMQKEVDSMHDDLSQMTEEEQRRRKKWNSSYSEFLNEELNAHDALIDIKASKPRNAWPFVNRDEIFAWIDDLRALGIDEAVQTLTQRLKDLDAPVRKSRPKTFKNGSIHDLSQSSTLPNTDEIRLLQDDKLRLEDRLKASDSRVRKLEDLLHRQSQIARPASGSFVPGGASDFERQVSPNRLSRPGDFSRTSSVSLRRLSNAQDEKSMIQKIGSLEAQIQKLHAEAHAERRSSTENRDKMEEAESVKRDLMANFEAQRQEFEDERQLLDDENHKLKIRVEELEDEMDRVLGSRDHLTMLQDQKVNNLKAELEQLQKASSEELLQAQQKHDRLQKDVTTHKDRMSVLDRQYHQIRDEKTGAQNQNLTMANQLRSYEELQQDIVGILQGVHANLSPAGSPPEDLRRLVNALEILSEGAAIHARGLDDSLQLMTAENRSLDERRAHAESQGKNLTERLAAAEVKSSSLAETLDHERSKLTAIREELAEEQRQSNSLREKLAAGETGSGALKERLGAEEKKVAELQEAKIENEGVIQSLRREIENLTSESKANSERQEKLKAHLDRRGEKARQLSERLFQHNDRIIRMLEQFGYSITRQDDTLVVQRASKANASTVWSGGEGSTVMKRTVSGGAPVQHYSDPSDLDTLYWTSDAEVANENTKYQSFLGALQRLDLDATIDTVTKRYKDVENMAKKYQKDSRAYREKAHRLQSEAHDKIAYRSFKEGDLALFLPTRNQATRPWAAFNVGAPHYFLREQDAHKLQSRDWLLARIGKVEERVVDLSRSMTGMRGHASSTHAEISDGASSRSVDDENPFELSDGLRWYMIDAAEEKPGAPGTPSVGKSTVTASNIDVKGYMGLRSPKDIKAGGSTSTAANVAQVTKNLSKSLDSRRSSTGSKKSVGAGPKSRGGDGSSAKDTASPLAPIASSTSDVERGGGEDPVVKPSDADVNAAGQTAREDARVFEVDNTADGNDGHYQHRSPRKLGGLEEGLAQVGGRSQGLSTSRWTSPVKPQPLGTGGSGVGGGGGVRPLPQSQPQSQGPSRTASPMKKSTTITASPAKGSGKPWDRLFSVEYNG